jgi:5S rRNA maturation endonuclease (ribonuclease M5)
MKKSTSFDQNRIKIVCDKLCDRIEDLLEHLDLEYKINNRFVSMCCPIHGGDNHGAINLYHIGDQYRGNWKCRTHNCEEVFKSSIIGFIRGTISHRKYNWSKQGDDICSFKEALDFATKFLDLSLKDIKISNTWKEKNTFIRNSDLLQNKQTATKTGPSRNTVRNNLIIPSQYFLDRGFSAEILDKYDIGDCKTQSKEMSNRAVVPIYDIDHKFMLGCSGRSLYNKCERCSGYHGKSQCPEKIDVWKFSKWRHSSGFKTQESLYNFWFAKDFIRQTNQVIIVESPGNVWKLEENNIHNSIAIFGANISDKQKTLLDISGAMEIVLIMDNDEAGEKGREQITKKCERIYNIKNIRISKNDIAEMSNEEITKEIKVYL